MFSFFIFIYNISSEKKNTLFSILEKDWLFIQKYLLYFYLMFPFVFIFIFYFMLFYFIIVFLMLFCVPCFRGNSLNSKAGLEFEEFWLFSTIIFQKNVEIRCFFFKS